MPKLSNWPKIDIAGKQTKSERIRNELSEERSPICVEDNRPDETMRMTRLHRDRLGIISSCDSALTNGIVLIKFRSMASSY